MKTPRSEPAARHTRVNAAGVVSVGRLRSLVFQALGGYSLPLRWYRRLRPRWIWERMNPLGKATRRYVSEQGLTVRRGLCSGLVYPAFAIGNVSFLPAKLLGCYEPELSPILEGARDFDVFVDIGSSDGYLCVGVKRFSPRTQVIGYETNAAEQRIAGKLAKLNDVSVEIRGTADHDALNGLPRGRLLLLSDVEGHEYELIDPSLVPRLREATMIIEVHPSVHHDIVEVLTSRFTGTHSASVVSGRPKHIDHYPELARWDEALASYAITEGRNPAGLWLVLRPQTIGTGSGHPPSEDPP